jgi:hypothetical protein
MGWVCVREGSVREGRGLLAYWGAEDALPDGSVSDIWPVDRECFSFFKRPTYIHERKRSMQRP